MDIDELREELQQEKWMREAAEAEVKRLSDALCTAHIARRRAEYSAVELERMLKQVRNMLGRGRTVGNDWRKAAQDAENFIIGLYETNESAPEDNESEATCSVCGHPMTHVRPGKWQCDHCAEITAYHAMTGDWPAQDA